MMSRLEAARKKLRGNYLASLLETATRLESAIVAERESEVASICHDIKGSGASFGFSELTALALEIESHRGEKTYYSQAMTLVTSCREIATDDANQQYCGSS